MKRFLPLLMLTGLLFGQDLLLLKSGKFYKGVFIDKVDENIIFNIEGDSIHTEISIYNVDIIKTDNGEYYYPFDIPTNQEYPIDILTKQEYPSKGWSGSRSFGYSSEKIAVSFYNFSLLNNIDEHSELFGTFTSIIFVSGIGLGYKYYIMGKSKSSLFISVSAQNYFTEDFLTEDFGLWTAAGVSLRKIGGKTSFNIGISTGISYNTPNIPFLNLERRF